MSEAVITWVDNGGIKASSRIANIPSESAIDAAKLLILATALRAHTSPGISSYAVLGWTETAVTDTRTATGINNDKGLVLFQYEENGETQYGQFWISNVNMAKYEMVEGEGYRMTAAAIALLQAAMNTAAGTTGLIITEGKIEYRAGKQGSPNQSYIRVRDARKVAGNIVFSLATDAAALTTFATSLVTDEFTNSVVEKTYFLSKTETIVDPTSQLGLPGSADFASVEQRMILKFAFSEDGKKKYMRLDLPGPLKTECLTKKKGRCLSRTQGAAIATNLVTFFGSANKTVRFVGSRFDAVDLQDQ